MQFDYIGVKEVNFTYPNPKDLSSFTTIQYYTLLLCNIVVTINFMHYIPPRYYLYFYNVVIN